jgi:cellobiose phosphorylase
MIAEALLGRGDRAFGYYTALLPSAANDHAERRTIEPYVYGQFVTGRWDEHFGVAHNPWLTGTASWAYVAATQYILGIHPRLDGLAIDPCIPPDWEGFRVTRVYRGATYRIRVRNPSGLSRGVSRLRVDRRAIEGCVVPVAPPGAAIRVEATLEGR